MNHTTIRQLISNTVLKTGVIPLVGESKNTIPVRHDIDYLAIIFPTTYHTGFYVILKTMLAQPVLKFLQTAVGSKFYYAVHIHRRANL